jgi:eukaryotic-like serine/threonine-protein kinase
MAGAETCPKCGAQLPHGALQGLCPLCLRKVVFGVGAAEPTVPPVSEKAGDRIGHYKLVQQIGEGGCGVVYLAEQEEPVRRQVALKIIKLGMDTREVIARFEAERQALALMDHPNIARVFDGGATNTGRPYFVMELVRGTKITDYCDEHALSTAERIHLFVQVCHAIQHAHQKGIIHRDIKPSNVLVMVHDDVPMPKVIDFGIAKAIGERLTDKTVFTRFEQFIGTPSYMSPEQAGLSGLDVDTRSDIYALGVLLYDLLTGHTPFDPRQLAKASLEEVLRRIREEEPPKPSTRLRALQQAELTTTAQRRQTEPPRLVSLLRGDLDWIVMKCLEKDRVRRYETANALALDLERHLNHQPVAAAAPTLGYRMGKFIRRHRAGLAVASALVALLVAGVLVSAWEAVRARRAERTQSQLRQQTEKEKKKAEQVAQFLKAMLEGVGPSAALGRDTVMLREILDKTAQRLDQELKDQPDVEADLRSTIGYVYYDLGQYTNAEAMFRVALAVRKKLLGNEHPAVAASLGGLASMLWAQGKFAEAETLYREALAMNRKLLGSEHPSVALSLNNVGLALWREGKLAEAEAMHREALALRKKLLGLEHPDVAASVNNLAGVLQEQSKFVEAETLFREALSLHKKLLGSEDPSVALSLNNLASVLDNEGKFVEAETLLRQAVAMQQKLLGSEHPYVAGSLDNLAVVLREQNKLAEAETMHREALAMRKKLLGGEHPEVATSLNNLAAVLEEQGKVAEAEALFREALAMEKKLLGSEHPEVAASLAGLADVLSAQGKLAEAETLQREALKMRNKLLGHEHPDVAQSLADLTRTLLLEEKVIEAEVLARECLAIYEKRFLQDWPTFDAWSLLGATLLGQKKYAEAEPLLLTGYKGMKDCVEKIPAAQKRRLKEALQHLVQLYDATGRPEEAARWKRELAARGL